MKVRPLPTFATWPMCTGKETRSYNMSRIKGKDTKPEMLVRRFLHAQGYRYRLHVKDLPGKPDIVLPKYKRLFSSMVASGMAMKVAATMLCLRHALNGGLIR